MKQEHIIILLIILAISICALSYIRKRPAVLLALISRTTAGLAFIYLFNKFCALRGIITHVGINPLTAAISFLLGLPGVFLAYGIRLLGPGLL